MWKVGWAVHFLEYENNVFYMPKQKGTNYNQKSDNKASLLWSLKKKSFGVLNYFSSHFSIGTAANNTRTDIQAVAKEALYLFSLLHKCNVRAAGGASIGSPALQN